MRESAMMEEGRAGFTLEWRVEKWILTCNLTYDFLLKDLQNTAWRIRLSDVGCSVQIQRLSKWNTGPLQVDIDCDLNLLLLQQEPCSLIEDDTPVKVEKISYKENWSSEKVKIVSKSVIDALKCEDVLLLRCRIWPRNSSLFFQPLREFVRCQEFLHCFMWTVQDFSLLQKGDKRNYVLQLTRNDSSCLRFDIFLGKDNDAIYIKQTVDKEFFCIHSIWMMDVRGGKTLCLHNVLPFDTNRDAINVPLHICKSKLLEEKEKFLPNDKLTLYFVLRITDFDVVLEKVIVGDSTPDNERMTVTLNTRDIITKGKRTPSSSDPSVTKQLPSTSNAAKLPTLFNSSMASDMHRLFHEGQLTDFELRIGSETVRVHKTVLAARSPVFLAMLTNEMRESPEQGVDIEDLEMDTVNDLLVFMYLDTVPDLDWNSTINLYSAADKYDVMELKKKCSEILKSKLCVQSVCPVLSLADMHSDDDLKQFVQEFIAQNESRIIPSQEWENFLNEETLLASKVMLFLCKKRIITQ